MKATLVSQSTRDRTRRKQALPPYFDESAKGKETTRDKKKKVKCKRTNTHIWIIVYIWDQVVNEGLQGPGHQVVVMVIEARVAFLLGLVQVLVVAAGVQLPRKRWSLRHVVLQREREQTQEQSVRTPNFSSDRYFAADADAGRPNKSKIALRHKHRRQKVCLGNGLDVVNTLPPPPGSLLSILSSLVLGSV